MTHALLAACLAMLLTIAAGYPLLAELRRRKFGKSADLDAPEAYATKAGTPTMGGVIFLLPILAVGLTMAVTRDGDTLLPLAAMLAAAALGVVDDFQTLTGVQRLSGHETWFWLVKWGALIAIGAVAAAVLHFEFDLEHALVPHFGAYSLGLLYLRPSSSSSS
jgi:phospho-N-acetylmuramoyl-pentapeptide-transferase